MITHLSAAPVRLRSCSCVQGLFFLNAAVLRLFLMKYIPMPKREAIYASVTETITTALLTCYRPFPYTAKTSEQR